MRDYADFLAKFAQYAVGKPIRWAVIGSHAMHVHARQNGIDPPRPAHDLDLIAIMPKHLDDEFRAWMDRRSLWVYERRGLGAVHVRCDDGNQVDIFTKINTDEFEGATIGDVLGLSCPVVSWPIARSAVERWAADTAAPAHPRHFDHQKYRDTAEWYGRNAPK